MSEPFSRIPQFPPTQDIFNPETPAASPRLDLKSLLKKTKVKVVVKGRSSTSTLRTPTRAAVSNLDRIPTPTQPVLDNPPTPDRGDDDAELTLLLTPGIQASPTFSLDSFELAIGEYEGYTQESNETEEGNPRHYLVDSQAEETSDEFTSSDNENELAGDYKFPTKRNEEDDDEEDDDEEDDDEEDEEENVEDEEGDGDDDDDEGKENGGEGENEGEGEANDEENDEESEGEEGEGEEGEGKEGKENEGEEGEENDEENKEENKDDNGEGKEDRNEDDPKDASTEDENAEEDKEQENGKESKEPKGGEDKEQNRSDENEKGVGKGKDMNNEHGKGYDRENADDEGGNNDGEENISEENGFEGEIGDGGGPMEQGEDESARRGSSLSDGDDDETVGSRPVRGLEPSTSPRARRAKRIRQVNDFVAEVENAELPTQAAKKKTVDQGKKTPITTKRPKSKMQATSKPVIEEELLNDRVVSLTQEVKSRSGTVSRLATKEKKYNPIDNSLDTGHLKHVLGYAYVCITLPNDGGNGPPLVRGPYQRPINKANIAQLRANVGHDLSGLKKGEPDHAITIAVSRRWIVDGDKDKDFSRLADDDDDDEPKPSFVQSYSGDINGEFHRIQWKSDAHKGSMILYSGTHREQLMLDVYKLNIKEIERLEKLEKATEQQKKSLHELRASVEKCGLWLALVYDLDSIQEDQEYYHSIQLKLSSNNERRATKDSPQVCLEQIFNCLYHAQNVSPEAFEHVYKRSATLETNKGRVFIHIFNKGRPVVEGFTPLYAFQGFRKGWGISPDDLVKVVDSSWGFLKPFIVGGLNFYRYLTAKVELPDDADSWCLKALEGLPLVPEVLDKLMELGDAAFNTHLTDIFTAFGMHSGKWRQAYVDYLSAISDGIDQLRNPQGEADEIWGIIKRKIESMKEGVEPFRSKKGKEAGAEQVDADDEQLEGTRGPDSAETGVGDEEDKVVGSDIMRGPGGVPRIPFGVPLLTPNFLENLLRIFSMYPKTLALLSHFFVEGFGSWQVSSTSKSVHNVAFTSSTGGIGYVLDYFHYRHEETWPQSTPAEIAAASFDESEGRPNGYWSEAALHTVIEMFFKRRLLVFSASEVDINDLFAKKNRYATAKNVEYDYKEVVKVLGDIVFHWAGVTQKRTGLNMKQVRPRYLQQVPESVQARIEKMNPSIRPIVSKVIERLEDCALNFMNTYDGSNQKDHIKRVVSRILDDIHFNHYVNSWLAEKTTFLWCHTWVQQMIEQLPGFPSIPCVFTSPTLEGQIAAPKKRDLHAVQIQVKKDVQLQELNNAFKAFGAKLKKINLLGIACQQEEDEKEQVRLDPVLKNAMTCLYSQARRAIIDRIDASLAADYIPKTLAHLKEAPTIEQMTLDYDTLPIEFAAGRDRMFMIDNSRPWSANAKEGEEAEEDNRVAENEDEEDQVGFIALPPICILPPACS
ncbi:hypothetical protein FA15DRAFT_711543 [Coprinopsis marcescibilis]|uniref:Uncharacterized protein n=1 Tax=Coprinopsis marcescibilis TaxID=230819 RepID=A0A5C3KAA5_COPMA|nr:hypothetical protein FA15DRAFT_711543 [Coprinopsis marcescibilis]